MDANAIDHYARRLIETHGERAELEAAQKGSECEKQHDQDQAQDWRRIQAAISQMRGPLVS
jgi:hypothetical protein